MVQFGMNEKLSEEETALLSRYREQILKSGYEPVSDEEMEDRRWADRNAVASAAIEGQYASPMQDALFSMFLELRVPDEICEDVLDQYMAYRMKHTAVPDATR